jgi:heme a synthase
LLLRRRRARDDARRPMTLACLLLAAQGAVGGLQYQLELPAELVWIHVALAAALWLVLLWAAAAVSSEPRRRAAGAELDRPHVAPGPPLVRS